MRITLPIKVLCLVILGAVTALVTNTILAQDRGASKRPKAVAQAVQLDQAASHTTVTTTETFPALPGGEAPPVVMPEKLGRGGLLAEFSYERLDVSAQGRNVFVSAQANLRDMRPGSAYCWSLRVTDAEDRNDVVLQHNYADQIFAMPAEQELRPTFDEQFQLAPGNYRVELGLLWIPGGTNIQKVDHENWADGHRIIPSSRRVTITD